MVACAAALATSAALAPPALEGQLPDSTAIVSGWVVDHGTGVALPGVTVTFEALPVSLGLGGTVVSDPEGGFTVRQVPAGLYRITASLLGYAQMRDTLRVEALSELEVMVPLSVSPIDLEPVVVVVRRRPVGPLAAFERRRANQRGIFFDRDDIAASNPVEFTDVMRRVPGVRLVPTATLGNQLFFRGGCTPDLWLDGVQIGSTVDMDTFLRVEDLEAVEVYRGPDLPGEFGTNLCGAIVAWTQRGLRAGESAENTSLLRQVILGASTLAVFIGIRMIR